MKNLKGKTVLITGASSGIGYATAVQCAEAGANLIVLARREDRLKALAESVDVDVLPVVCDMTDKESIDNALAVLADKKIDVLINNAGLALGLSPLDSGDTDDGDRMIDTNVKGLLRFTRGILPGMVSRESGHVVNIGSIAGREVYANGVVYCATKYAVKAISEGLKQDVHGKNIRVTLISPGAVNTEFSKVRFHGDDKRADTVYDKMQPLLAEDIADTILFAITRPAHVNVAEIFVMPTAQSAATMIARD